MSTTENVDVAIIGAGLAGLTAARQLVKQGLSVVVLEATERVGGRTLNHAVDGGHVDLGGTFVGPEHHRLLSLAREVGCQTYPTYDKGQQVIDLHGKRRTYRGSVPPLGAGNLVKMALLQRQLENLSRTIPSDKPWLAPRAHELDSITFADWLHAKSASPTICDLFTLVARTTWGCELNEISFLHVLHYLNESGGLGPMLATGGGAQQDHFIDGSAEISRRIAADLGHRIHLNCPATAIEWSDNTAMISTPDNTFLATRVIIAAPPAARRAITFTPALPAPWADIADVWPQGVLSKAYAIYDTPFWRSGSALDRGEPLSGQAQSTAGPVFITFDASPHAPHGRTPNRGILLGFIGGNLARTWDKLPAEERRIRALASFATLFGPDALNPIDYVDQRWAEEPWINGGPTAAPRPGAWTGVGIGLATPVGPIHWAGTETALRATGFMDGAVRSGEKAAAEVAEALTTTPLNSTTR